MGEVSNQLSINFIGLGAYQTRGAKGLDLRRVDNAHHHTKSCQIFCNTFPIGASRLHAHSRVAGIMLEQPFFQYNKSFVVVLYYLVTVLAIGQAQRAVKLCLVVV